MRRKATFPLLRPSFQAENGDCWPEYDGAGSVMGRIRFLERVTAAAEQRQLSLPKLRRSLRSTENANLRRAFAARLR